MVKNRTNGFANDFNTQMIQPPSGITGYKEITDTQGNRRYVLGDRGDNTWRYTTSVSRQLIELLMPQGWVSRLLQVLTDMEQIPRIAICRILTGTQYILSP